MERIRLARAYFNENLIQKLSRENDCDYHFRISRDESPVSRIELKSS